MGIDSEYLAEICGLNEYHGYQNIDLVADCISDLKRMMEQKLDSKADNIPEWVEKNRSLKGKPFKYDNADIKMMLGDKDKELKSAPRPYLMQYLKDDCAEKVVIKSRQSEFTENELNVNLFLCCHRDYTSVMHVFPTYKMGTKISSQKILPAIKESPSIHEMVKKPNISKTLTQFVNGSMYLIEGSFGEMGGRASSVDKITYDEYESQSPAVEAVFDETLSHSALKLKTKISTPLLPNGGIDGEFNTSCQFEWEIECPHCHKRQIMSFPENIINYFEQDYIKLNSVEYIEKIKNVYIGCKYCKTYIDRTTPNYIKTSKWVALQPHLIGLKNGYRVTAFVMPWKTGREILYTYHTTKYLHQFYNETLGYAYMSPEASLNRACFEQCVVSLANSFANLGYIRSVSVGIDWGDKESWVVVRANGVPPDRHKCHVVYVERIDEDMLKRHGFAGRTEEHVDRAMQIIDFFKAEIIVNDANGIGKDRNSILTRNYPGRAFGVFYDTAEIEKMKRNSKVIEPQWSKDKVTISRVGMARLLIREYMRGEIGIPQIDLTVDLFIQHHLNIGVVRRFDEKTGQEYEIVGKTGPDHYFHADIYSKTGYDNLVPEDEFCVGVI